MAFTSSTMVIYSVGIFLLISNQLNGVKSENEIKWHAEFDTSRQQMSVGTFKIFGLTLKHLNKTQLMESNSRIQIVSSHFNILPVMKAIPLNDIIMDQWKGNFSTFPTGIGQVNVTVHIIRDNVTEISSEYMHFKIHRILDVYSNNALLFSSLSYICTVRNII